MKKPIQISIPTPCHENWDAMTPADKGRFCASCQKTVYDFTSSSDREIASILKNTNNACGRFRATQLDRDLVIPKEKSTLWMAASAAVVSFLTIGIQESMAQQSASTAQIASQKTKKKKKSTTFLLPEIQIKGRVVDTDSSSIPNANIRILRTNQTITTDIDGSFEFTASKNDTIEVSYTGMITKYITLTEDKKLTITLVQDAKSAEFNIESCRVISTRTVTTGAMVVIEKTIYAEEKRTFFGRMFHSIGNIFR
jgi:hypothetical protein